MKPPRYNVAVVGATGLVGRQFLNIFEERRFPFHKLRLFASATSRGQKITVCDETYSVEELTERSFTDMNLAFFSASADISHTFIPEAVKAGCVAIDDSSAWRMDPSVPLVVPEVNGDDLLHHRGIIAIPNCTTTPLVHILAPLHRTNPLRRVIVDTYQAVSGTGKKAVHELQQQIKAQTEKTTAAVAVYPHPIAFNVFPHVGTFLESGYTKEEQKIIEETKKILHAPALLISATCVRVPVLVGHSEAIHLEFSHPMTCADVRNILSATPGVVVEDDPATSKYPFPLLAAGKDATFVGRIRNDASCPQGIALWIASDNLRKGAALNAMQIAEQLHERGLL